MEMEFPLNKPAMRLLIFQIFALTVKVVFNLIPDEVQVAPALKLAQFDRSGMSESTFYAESQVRSATLRLKNWS